MRNYNNQNQNNNKKEREKYHLKFTPAEFDGSLKSKVTTTIDLSKNINSIFKPFFVDYEGCIILPENNGRLGLSLYFKDKNIPGSDKLKALKPVVATSHSTGFQRIANWNMRTRNKKYALTNEIKDVLNDFVSKKRNGKVNWNQLVFEQTQQEYNMYSIYVKIVGLDLNKIIKKIYGNKDDKGNRFDYNISLLKPIGNLPGNMQQNFMISIQQLNTKEVEKLLKLVGMVPTSGTIPMVR